MRLKAEPEDFVVEEVPTKGFLDRVDDSIDHPFLVVRARKRDCAHFDLVRTITKRFGIPEAELGIGGIKDRRAVTEQLVTLKNVARIREPLEAGIVDLEPQTGDASLELVGSSRRRMTIGTLFGNRFTILARDLTSEERASLQRNLMHHPLGVPNYFGRQRFGRNLENVELGYALLTQDFAFVRDTLLSSSEDDPLTFARRISRRKRMLYVSAFQSALFNAELIDRIQGGVIDRLSAQSDRVRVLASIANERVYASDYALRDEIPIVSLGAELTDFQQRVLELLDLSARNFAIRSMPDLMFEPVTRASVIDVSFDDFSVDTDARLEFFLPKGSYATIVFEQLEQ